MPPAICAGLDCSLANERAAASVYGARAVPGSRKFSIMKGTDGRQLKFPVVSPVDKSGTMRIFTAVYHKIIQAVFSAMREGFSRNQ